MPEHAEAEKAPADIGPKSLGEELRHHGAEPEQPGRDVKAVTADKREKAGKKSAPRRSVAMCVQRREFGGFEQKECEAEKSGNRKRGLGENLIPLRDSDRRKTAEEA